MKMVNYRYQINDINTLEKSHKYSNNCITKFIDFMLIYYVIDKYMFIECHKFESINLFFL